MIRYFKRRCGGGAEYSEMIGRRTSGASRFNIDKFFDVLAL